MQKFYLAQIIKKIFVFAHFVITAIVIKKNRKLENVASNYNFSCDKTMEFRN